MKALYPISSVPFSSAFFSSFWKKIIVIAVAICLGNLAAVRAQQAYQFNGSSSINIPHSSSLNFDTAITIQVWVNIAVTGDQRIIDKAIAGAGGGPFSMDTYLGRLRVFLNSTTQTFVINPAASFPTNSWVNIAVTYSKSQGQMIAYQNAVEVGRVAMSGNLFQNTLPIKIGTPASGGSINGLLQGKADEVRLYNRALPVWELAANLNCELRSTACLQLYLKLNETGGTVVNDASGNGNNGSISGIVSRDVSSPVTTGSVCATDRSLVYVNAAATGGANNGSSWANAYTSLSEALRQTNAYSAACATTEIWIAKGKYYPERDPLGNAAPADNRDKTFYISKPVKLIGGFAGTETNAAQRVAGNTTVLSGDLGILNNNNDNAYHVLMNSSTGSLELDRLVIQDGNANVSKAFVAANDESFSANRGGGFIMKGGATITNTVFSQNVASNGGAIFCDASSSSNNSFKIRQSVFTNNTATTGSAFFILPNTNNLLFGVTITKNTGASTIFKEVAASVTIRNSILTNNSGRSINSATGTTVTYSIMQDYTGGGTNVSNAVVRFVNDTLPAGPDGEWLTADDGLIPADCVASDAADFAQHITGDKDILFNNRFVNLTYVPNTGVGSTPFMDLGAYENSFNGDTSLFRGQIGNAHLVSNPRQRIPDSVSSINPGVFPAGVIPAIRWEKSIFPTSSFTAADSINNRSVYYLPAFPNTLYFRRVQEVCGIPYTSNVVEIKVLPANGTLQGKVVVQNTILGVDSVLITIQKQNDYPGSPQSRIDSTYTQVNNGVFGFSNLFYDGNSTAYIVKAKKGQNRISPDSILLNLPANGQFLGEITFQDETALSISGRIFQQCIDCIGSTPGNPVLAPLDSAAIFKREPGRSDTTQITTSGLLNGQYGAYSFTVQATGRATVLPRYRRHRFEPYSREVQVTGPQNINNDFVDTTTRLITGRFGAGCNDASIGSAEIEFVDVLPNDANGQPRPSVFTKKVNTAIDGTYSIRLPARKYRVSRITFTPNSAPIYPTYARVSKDSVEQFFQRLLVSDSFQRDITDSNAVLNLTYHRPPEIVLEQFDDACSSNGFVLMQQLEEKRFKATVYQGSALLNCPAPAYSGKGADTLVMISNVPFDDVEQSIRLHKDSARIYGISLMGGVPKTVGDYKKKWLLEYRDPFGRYDSVKRDVVVTGARSQGSTFQTVSPELPFMIVHDPPGSGSFATWQQDQARESTIRMFANSEKSLNAWTNVKIGTEFSAGLGYEIKTAIWGSVNAGVTTTQTVTSENESIIALSNSQGYSTFPTEDAIGDGADVIIGGAVNFVYARALVLEARNGCQLVLDTQLIVSPKGFRTWYAYTQNFIEQNLIPRLQRNAALATSDSTAERLRNEVKVWQQVLANNAANKAKAPFEDNRSFNGNTTQTWTSTISNSSSNTIEFNMSIDSDLAAELGLEIAGAGISGGVNVAFKMEQGKSTNNTFTKSTTTSYTLTDDDENNFYSVDVKKDPVYNTPVFELKSGTSACPYVPGTQPRDGIFFEVDKTAQTNVPANGAAIFNFKVYNTSPSEETRSYIFNFDRLTNTDVAKVEINGLATNSVDITNLAYGDSARITVTIQRGVIDTVYSFEGLRFSATDACGGELSKSIVLSASFVSPCSSAAIDLPENWLVNSDFNNNVPIRISGYNKAALNTLELQYSKVGASGWTTGFSLSPAQLSNNAEGTNAIWHIADLIDTAYQVRAKVGCNGGVVYTPRVIGLIDRTAPALFGKPQPSDDVFSRGDEISIRYSENIAGVGLAQKLALQRIDNLQYLPIQVSSFANAIMVIPQFNPDTLQGKEVRLIAQNISDAFGNTRTLADSIRFVFAGGNAIASTRLLSVSVSNATVQEFAATPIRVKFSLNNIDTIDTKIRYTLAGSGTYNRDFTVGYLPDRRDSFPNAYAINNVQGSLVIPAGKDSAVLLIYPINNDYNDSSRSVLVSAIATGDYGVSAAASIQANILNEDASRMFVFTGSGNFSTAANWQNQVVPPPVLQVNDHIFINPGGDGSCVLDIPLQVMPGGKVSIAPGKKLTVKGGVFIRK